MRSFLLLIGFVSSLSIFAESTNAVLDKVVLYQGAVELHQTASIYVSQGRNEIRVLDIPERIMNNTLNVSTTSSAFISSFDHLSEKASTSKWKDAIALIEDSLEDVALHLKQLNAELEVYNEEWNLITKNNTRVGTDGGLDGVDLQEAADFFRSRLGAIKDQMLQIERGVRSQNQLKKSLEKRLRQLRNDLGRIGVVELVINSPINQKIDIQIQYLTYQAAWRPSYRINYLNEEQTLLLDYNAMVYNNTGINWEGVQFSLVTGLPKTDMSEPELDPKYLHFVQPILRKSKGQHQQQAMKSMAYAPKFDGARSEGGEMILEEALDDVELESSGAWTEFKVNKEQFIPSDGKEYIIPIKEVSLSAEYYYLCIPKQENEAYYMAKVKDWESLNLLAGRANVYNEGKYVGSIQIDPLSVDNHILIPLGTDGRLVLSREANPEFTTTKSIGSNLRKSFAYDIKLKNNRTEKVKVIIEDQVPVSNNNMIEVDIEDLSGAKHIPAEGLLKWELEIEPAASFAAPIKYVVKYPKDRRVNL